MSRRLTPARAVVLVGGLALIAAALIALTGSAQRRSGTNLTDNVGYQVGLGPGQQLCEPGEVVPGDTAALRLAARPQSGAGEAMEATVAAGRQSSAGRLGAGWGAGAIRIPLKPTLATTAGGTVCVRNLGARPVSFGGSVPDGSYVVLIDGRALGGRVRIEYMRPGSESWLSLAPVISHRFSLGKAGVVRHWAVAAVLVLMLLVALLAARIAIAAEERP